MGTCTYTYGLRIFKADQLELSFWGDALLYKVIAGLLLTHVQVYSYNEKIVYSYNEKINIFNSLFN